MNWNGEDFWNFRSFKFDPNYRGFSEWVRLKNLVAVTSSN